MGNMSETDHKDLLMKLKEYEKKTVEELLSRSFRLFETYDDFSKCPNQAAVNRLGAIYEKDGDSIARFRLSGRKRLYGFLIDNQFHIVWWDPEHQIWPSKKKHT